MKQFYNDEFLKLLKELKDCILIVEGKKDKKVLKTFKLNNIVPINGKPLYKIVEEIRNIRKNNEDVVILTDFDKKGTEIAVKLRNLLEKHKIKYNKNLRRKLMWFGKNKIEDFKRVLNPMEKEGDNYGEISANFNKIFNKNKNKSKRRDRKTGRNRGCFWSD